MFWAPPRGLREWLHFLWSAYTKRERIYAPHCPHCGRRL